MRIPRGGLKSPMRVAAVGWLAKTEAEADQLAAAQAAVSHDHPEAIKAAQAVARAIFALIHGQAADVLRASLIEEFGYDLRSEIALVGDHFDVSAAGTTPTALAAAFDAKDWEGAVRTVVGFGGDTDTLACIAGAVAEAILGVPEAIAGRARAYLTADLLHVLERFDELRSTVWR